MRKTLHTLFTAIAFLAINMAAAKTLVITVSDYSFSPDGSTPSAVSINLGDSVQWQWMGGWHTTSGGTVSSLTYSTIPSGAAGWNSQISNTATSFTYVPTVTGTYNYVCYPHASMGMVASFIVNCASVPATPVITSSNGSSGCQGGSVNMSIPAQAGATYQWYSGSTMVANTTNSMNATASGSYTIQVTRCGTTLTSGAFTATINPKPTPSFTTANAGLAYTFTNTTTPATGNTYLWTFSDNSPNQTTANATRTFASSGVYTVTLKATTTATTCFASTSPLTIRATVGVGMLAGESYSILPNPAADVIIINTPADAGITLTDFNGRKISAPLTVNGRERRLDVRALPAGMYLLHIATAKGAVVEKVSVMH